ncbi:uncharacterized protein LOC144246241 isoform X2 [Lonchura striata]
MLSTGPQPGDHRTFPAGEAASIGVAAPCVSSCFQCSYLGTPARSYGRNIQQGPGSSRTHPDADSSNLWQRAPVLGEGAAMIRRSRQIAAVKALCARQSSCKMSLVRMSGCPRPGAVAALAV